MHRTKERNKFICNKVTENHADEIVSFKNGYFLTQPAMYVSRSKGSEDKVDKLNEYLYRSGKLTADNETVDWFHTVGRGAIFVQSVDDRDVPFRAYALDPRSAFVVKSMRPGNEPVMGVHMAIEGEDLYIDVYSRTKYYKLSGTVTGKLTTPEKNFIATAVTVEDESDLALGAVPIIEYNYNSVGMGAFESVISLLDSINLVQSNRLDGVEQFIQNLVVLYNCQLPEGEDANSLRDKGLLLLRSVGENKAAVDILTQELNQSQTQVLVDWMYEQVLKICAMPSTTKGGASTSDTGAAVLARDGWYQADSAARNTEDLFKASNRSFDEIVVKLLRDKGLLDISINDFELNFVRNETANAQSKAQTLQTLLAAGMAPELAFARSGISHDPVADVKISEKYLKMIWGDPEAAVEAEEAGNGQGEALIIEEDRNTGDNATGGAV